MITARTIPDARAATAPLPRPLGLVPTMGALHEGHLSLIRAAKERCESVAVSIFVNPLQFQEGEDYEHYPHDEARDLELAESEGVDVVFAPTIKGLYPEGYATTVHVAGALTETLEGASRPGHFDGVTTIVSKLIAVVAPDVAFFGRKDAQQLAVIRRFVADLDLAVEIADVETIREKDGLALSSRNVLLSEEERVKAADLYRALETGRELAGEGRKVVVDDVTGKLVLGFPPYMEIAHEGPEFSVDYVEVVDPVTFEPADPLTPESLIVVAARLGETRLIDSLPVGEAATRQSVPAPFDGPVEAMEG